MPEVSTSSEATELATRLACKSALAPAALSVDDIRSQLAEEFEPRHLRARARFAPFISYMLIDGLRCMVIEPKVKTPKGILFYLFGGGYVSGAPDFELPIAAYLSEACQMRVVLPYYSLAPEHPYPKALNELVSVYKALSEETAGPITVCGESAGGGLALLMVNQLARAGATGPDGLCLFSPWVDLSNAGLAQCDQMDDPSTTTALLRASADAYCTASERKTASPLFDSFCRDFPKTYVSTGSRDIMLPVLDDLAATFARAGADLQMKIWPGMWHVFEIYDELPEAKTALSKAASFINGLKEDDE